MTPPRPSPVTCLIPFITYGFVPAIQYERALAFVGIYLYCAAIRVGMEVAVTIDRCIRIIARKPQSL